MTTLACEVCRAEGKEPYRTTDPARFAQHLAERHDSEVAEGNHYELFFTDELTIREPWT